MQVGIGPGPGLAHGLDMVRFAFLILFLMFSAPLAQAKTLIRCQLVEGYELAVQNTGRAYYLSLMYGGKVEYQERLKKPRRIKLDTSKEAFDFEVLGATGDDYQVKISAHFDDESSFDEIVHYKIPPHPKKPKSYKLYEVAGDGLPLKELGCVR